MRGRFPAAGEGRGVGAGGAGAEGSGKGGEKRLFLRARRAPGMRLFLRDRRGSGMRVFCGDDGLPGRGCSWGTAGPGMRLFLPEPALPRDTAPGDRGDTGPRL